MPTVGPQIARPHPPKEGDSTEYRRFDPQTIALLANLLIQSVDEVEPDFRIGGQADPYLNRWHLRRVRHRGSIYLHQMLHDDDDRAQHDHPWDSVSIVLVGTLREILPDGARTLRAGDMVFRTAEQAHRLEIVEGPVWTLFITGKVVREWGFHCPKGWIPWQEFVAADDTGAVGKGCGE